MTIHLRINPRGDLRVADIIEVRLSESCICNARGHSFVAALPKEKPSERYIGGGGGGM